MPLNAILSNKVEIFDMSESEDVNIDQITKNTVNTWQVKRDENEKSSDTKQGKLAEAAFEELISRNKDLVYISYDSFRKDNYAIHAPFDGVILRRNNKHEDEIKELVNDEISEESFGKLAAPVRQKIRDLGGMTIEIKSTKIADRHRKNTTNDLDVSNRIINSDDFIHYPKHIRKSDDITSTLQYLEYNERKDKNYNRATWRADEEETSPDLLIRIYVDGKKAYVIGYMAIGEFMGRAEIKKMPKFGKNTSAIYLAVSLRFRKTIDKISENVAALQNETSENEI